MLDKLPDEILLFILTFLVNNTKQLIEISQVSKRYNRLVENPKLWYLTFQTKYPIWSSRVNYTFKSHCLIDWKDFVIHLIKQRNSAKHLSFEFVKEQFKLSKKRKRPTNNMIEFNEHNQDEVPFWIQDPLVVDIDRITNTGIVGTGKHRKNVGYHSRSEHKILFWEYPSWKLIRVFELKLQPHTLTCQIISIQSVRMLAADNKTYQKVRFFSLAVGVTLTNDIDIDNEDRVDIWKSLFVYRLFDDGSTQCMAHIKINDLFLGREVFFFSDTSWCQSNDGDEFVQDYSVSKLKSWMKIVLPRHQDFDSRYTVFMLAMGPIYHNVTGCVQIAKFDIRGQGNILDPSTTPVIWDNRTHQLVSIVESCSNIFKYSHTRSTLTNHNHHNRQPPDSPTEMITSIQLGNNVSCMIHFKYPPYLNHLICTGSSHDDELSVYDWRFGLKVGSLPWKTLHSPLSSIAIQEALENNPQVRQVEQFEEHIQENTIEEAGDEEEGEELIVENEDTMIDVRPWGLESTLVLPPYWANSTKCRQEDVAQHGFRLIAVGDNRSENIGDKLEIKVWDISYLLQVKWDPLKDDDEEDDTSLFISDYINNYLTQHFSWWPRRTKELTKIALCMIHQSEFHRRELFHFNFVLNYSNRLLNQGFLLNTNHNNHTHNSHNHNHINNTNSNTRYHTNIQPENNYSSFKLPYSPPTGFQSILLSHIFDKDEQQQYHIINENIIPVKYTAYNVLHTSLFLLTEDGKVTVMDIETGQITGTVDNIAESKQIKGIDINVIGGKEVVITSKEGLLRGVVI